MDLTLQSLLAEAAVESPFPIIITDRDGLIEYINPAFTQVTGYALSELKGKTPRVFKSSQTSSLVHKHLWETILEGKVWQGEVCNRKKNGEEFWESIAVHSIKDSQGRIAHFVGIWQDITSRRKHDEIELLEKEIFEKQSRTDDLTGLYNRRHIFVEIEREIQRAVRYKRDLVGMMIDIDNFKQINDQYGHGIGDRVLCSFARILEDSIRTIDILGRYGGDEFLVILPETQVAEAKIIAERIQKKLSQYQENVMTDFINFTSSIGLVLLDEGCRGNKNLFFERMDHVLLLAKRAGKNTVVVG